MRDEDVLVALLGEVFIWVECCSMFSSVVCSSRMDTFLALHSLALLSEVGMLVFRKVSLFQIFAWKMLGYP